MKGNVCRTIVRPELLCVGVLDSKNESETKDAGRRNVLRGGGESQDEILRT